MQEAGWEIASHGLRWIDYRNHSREDEARRPGRGHPPPHRGHGRDAARLVHRPHLDQHRRPRQRGRHLRLRLRHLRRRPALLARARRPPAAHHSLQPRSQRHALLDAAAFTTSDDYFTYLKDSFDVLYAEGDAGAPKMFSVGLHCRLVGRPGRVAGLARFIDYIQDHDTRLDAHPPRHRPPLAGPAPGASRRHPPHDALRSRTSSAPTAAFTSIRRGSPSAPSRSSSGRPTTAPSASATPSPASSARRRRRSASASCTAHPDLAGKLAAAKRLTAESTAEQASAGLERPDRLRTHEVHRAQRRLPGRSSVSRSSSRSATTTRPASSPPSRAGSPPIATPSSAPPAPRSSALPPTG